MSTASETAAAPQPAITGEALHSLVRRLYPICRSITGDGVRETLAVLGETLPLEIVELPTGTQVLDWTVPREWNIRAAHIRGPDGRKVVDFADHNLHVMSYSSPVDATLSLEELRPHLHSLPDHPDWIPYRTSYYREQWGFCLPHRHLDALQPGNYEVFIDSTLEPGALTYGELLVPGQTDEEVLIFTHVCHPSLCNDNLSGIAVAAFLAAEIRRAQRRYSYRFVFAPATIGSICWLSRNEERTHRIAHGLVLGLLGDSGPFTYKKSRRGDADIDRAVPHVLKHHDPAAKVLDFAPYGYDERQFCSPGFNLPVGRLTRTPNGEFPEYHTSADDPNLVTPDALGDAYRTCMQILDVLDGDAVYVNLSPKCEPQLGKRGLYRATGGRGLPDREWAILWVLNLSDGTHSLLDIARRAELPFAAVRSAADELLDAKLLAPRAARD